MPAVLRLLGGSVDVASPRGRRTIAAEELFVGPLESTLAHDEIAVEAFFPALAAGAGRRVRRDRPPARRLRAVRGRRRWSAVTATGSRRPGPATSRSATSHGRRPDRGAGRGVTDAALAAAGDTALAGLEPADDIHATAAYRAQLVRVLTAPGAAIGVATRAAAAPTCQRGRA